MYRTVKNFCGLLSRFSRSFDLRKWPIFLFVNPKFANKYKKNINELFFQINTIIGERSNLFMTTSKLNIIKDADYALSHNFKVLSNNRVVEGEINWSKDVNSGIEWPSKIYYLKNKIQLDDSSDIKVVWDKSRCLHICDLSQGYFYTKDEKYSKEAISQMTSWIKDNPIMYSVNWTNSMEVAIRAINWVYTLQLISDSKLLTDNFSQLISGSLYQHGFFIYNNLENYDEYNANHYIADLSGLIYIGLIFNNIKQGKEWLEYGIKHLYNEIRIQVLPSGFHYEKSISYHRLVLEICLYTLKVLKNSGHIIPNDIIYRLKKMCEVIFSYTMSNGYIPNIGDDDDGRFLDFYHDSSNSHSYLIKLFEKEFGDIMSLNLKNDINALDAGFVTRKMRRYDIIVTNSGMSKYPIFNKVAGTHTHCDLLSFVLCVGGNQFIIDPGSYCYTKDIHKRQEYRSTRSHNTLLIDNIEQFELDSTNVFAALNNCNVSAFGINDNLISASYSKNIDGKILLHKRVFKCNNDDLTITDDVQYYGSHQCVFNLHFSSDCRLKCIDKDCFEILNNQVVALIKFEIIGDYNTKISKVYISPKYGVELVSSCISLECNFNNNVKIKTIIQIIQV